MSDKDQPGPDARLAEAGPHTTLDNERADKGMPSVGAPRLGYALPPRPDGNIYARPIIVTSVESTRQLVSGHVFTEPEDTTPGFENMMVFGTCHYFIRNAKMGNPAEPGTCHWLAYNYVGRSDGPGLTPIGSTEVTQDVSEGNTEPANAPVAPTLTRKEQRQQDRADKSK